LHSYAFLHFQIFSKLSYIQHLSERNLSHSLESHGRCLDVFSMPLTTLVRVSALATCLSIISSIFRYIYRLLLWLVMPHISHFVPLITTQTFCIKKVSRKESYLCIVWFPYYAIATVPFARRCLHTPQASFNTLFSALKHSFQIREHSSWHMSLTNIVEDYHFYF
jgi:hypothetical protein